MQKERVQIYENAASAVEILMVELGISQDAAKGALVALFKANIIVAPLEPTNSMLSAYLEAVRPPPRTRHSILSGVAKARRRWRAMGIAGNKVAVSASAGERDAAYDVREPEFHRGATASLGPTLHARTSKAPSNAQTLCAIACTGETVGRD